jgi:hypothetical protein
MNLDVHAAPQDASGIVAVSLPRSSYGVAIRSMSNFERLPHDSGRWSEKQRKRYPTVVV